MKNIVILLILLVGCQNAPTAVEKKPDLVCQVCDGFGMSFEAVYFFGC